MGKGQYFQQMVLGKQDSQMKNKETGLLSYTLPHNQLKMD